MPSRNLMPSSLYTIFGAILVGLIGLFNFRDRGWRERDEVRP
jgi:hypothetical protein